MDVDFVDRIVHGDCLDLIPTLPDNSIHCLVSDIPYGINLDDWDVLHTNTNAGLLGQSPAQVGKRGFQRRNKPIRGWNTADRAIPRQYQAWCTQWAALTYPKLKDGASLFIFGARRTLHRAIVALEDSGFLLRDILAWQKPTAHYRAQRLSGVLSRRGLLAAAAYWSGWRLGNLAPIWEPIAWMFKPYRRTLTDTILQNEVGAINVEAVRVDGKMPSNKLDFWFEADEARVHEAQKPVQLLEFLVKLATREGQIVLDPFIGSGSTAVACQNLNRRYIGFEINPDYAQMARERLH
jgi:site-specific DNA-methyltransferase (adenine-specific)